MANHTPKELRKLVKIAFEQGWAFARTSKGHVKFSAPDGTTTVFYSGTPGDYRAHANLLSKLRRGGLDIPRTFKS